MTLPASMRTPGRWARRQTDMSLGGKVAARPGTDTRPTGESASHSGGPLDTVRAPAASIRTALRTHRVALALLGVAAIYRLALLLRGWPALNSDEAIIGLMARHILAHGDRPIFYWGQDYMGAFQAYFAALLFAVFGSSTLVLHLSVLVLTLGFLAAVYAVGTAAYGRAAGLLTLGWLTVGPSFGVLRELSAIGGYQEMLLCAALVLLGVWARLRRPERLPRTRREWIICLLTYAGIGLAAGLGLWSDLLILPVLVVAALALLAGRTRETLHMGGLVLALTFVLGAFPFLSFNITHGNATVNQLINQSRPPGRSGSLPTLTEWQNQIGETLTVALPAVLGSPHVCVNRGDIWGGYPPSQAESTPAVGGICGTGNLLFSLSVLALYLVVAWQLFQVLLVWMAGRPGWPRRTLAMVQRRAPLPPAAHGWLTARLREGKRRPRASAGLARSAEQTAAWWLRAMLLGIAVLTLLPYVSSIDADRFQFTSGRYLIPLYLTVPLLFGLLWQYAAPHVAALAIRVRERRRTPTTHSRPGALPSGRRGWLAGMALTTLLAFSVVGGALTLNHAWDTRSFALPMSPTDQQLVSFMDAHDITAFYSDYWVCYRLAFETSEHLSCAVRGQNGEPSLKLMNNRYDPYVRTLAAVPNPAYVLPAGSAEDAGFHAEAAAQGLPHSGYQRAVVAGYAIYFPGP